MSGFDFDATLRWARFDPRQTLKRREDEALPFATSAPEQGQPLLVDTCVCIDLMQKRLPQKIKDLMDFRQINCSTVIVQELLHTVGVLDPKHPETAGTIAIIGRVIKLIPRHRLFAPDAEVLGRAALLAGTLCRLQGYAKDDRLRAQHDCVLFLQAQRLGFTVLTRNVRDFDFLLQLLPASRVLLYRA